MSTRNTRIKNKIYLPV